MGMINLIYTRKKSAALPMAIFTKFTNASVIMSRSLTSNFTEIGKQMRKYGQKLIFAPH